MVKQSLRNHFQKRCRERIGHELSEPEIASFKEMVYNNQLIAARHVKVSHRMKYYIVINNAWYSLVYDKKHDEFVTVIKE
jgi:hypothetical protein